MSEWSKRTREHVKARRSHGSNKRMITKRSKIRRTPTIEHAAEMRYAYREVGFRSISYPLLRFDISALAGKLCQRGKIPTIATYEANIIQS